MVCFLGVKRMSRALRLTSKVTATGAASLSLPVVTLWTIAFGITITRLSSVTGAHTSALAEVLRLGSLSVRWGHKAAQKQNGRLEHAAVRIAHPDNHCAVKRV